MPRRGRTLGHDSVHSRSAQGGGASWRSRSSRPRACGSGRGCARSPGPDRSGSATAGWSCSPATAARSTARPCRRCARRKPWFAADDRALADVNGTRYLLTLGEHDPAPGEPGPPAGTPVHRGRTQGGGAQRLTWPTRGPTCRSAASCGTAPPESRWSHITLGLPAITLRTSPPATTAGGRCTQAPLLDPISVFFRTSIRGVAAVISQPSRHCTVELQALPSRIGQVRRIVSAQLRYWHLDPLIDRAALGVTELLTNVHRHAQPDKTVHRGDRAAARPAHGLGARPRPAAARACARRRSRSPPADAGSRMVAAVSESWGVRPDGESGQGRVVHAADARRAARLRGAPVRRRTRPRGRRPLAGAAGRRPQARTRSRPVGRCRLTGR